MFANKRSASLAFVFITVAIDSIGLGIVIPVLPDVIRRFVSEEAAISRYYGFFVATYALMNFVSSPFLGSLSDRFGRRPVLLLSLLGAAIDYAFMAFAPTLGLLFLGRVISGVSGASFTVASAYVVDISDDKTRSRNFGIVGAGFGLGFILGPAIGGLLASYGPAVPFLAAACFNLLNFLFGYFVLPESLSPSNRRNVDWMTLNPLRSLKNVLSLPAIRVLVVIHVLIQLANQTHPSIWTLYTQHRFNWSAAEVGISLTVVGVLSAFSQGFLTGFLVKKLGERTLLTIGCLGEAVSFFFFGFSFTGTMIYFVLIISSIFWSMPPALQSLISREVPATQQGELQGSLMSLTSLTSIANPLIMTNLFAVFSRRQSEFYLPGAPYFVAGTLLLFAWGFALLWRRRTTRS